VVVGTMVMVSQVVVVGKKGEIEGLASCLESGANLSCASVESSNGHPTLGSTRLTCVECKR
jgi:hypothetical protein